MYLHHALDLTLAASLARRVPARSSVRLAIVGAVLLVPVNPLQVQHAADLVGDPPLAADVASGPIQTLLPAVFVSKRSGLKQYDKIVTDAQQCTHGEKCAIAGGVKGCRCPVAVLASAKQRVDKAAREASCEQVERLYCPPLENPRCREQACVADQVREER